MLTQIHQYKGLDIAEVQGEGVLIAREQDAVDLIGTLYFGGHERIILHQKNLSLDFFKLSTLLAGTVLQKFSNYRMRVAIVGNFEIYRNTRFEEFMREQNRGRQVHFVNSLEEALEALASLPNSSI